MLVCAYLVNNRALCFDFAHSIVFGTLNKSDRRVLVRTRCRPVLCHLRRLSGSVLVLCGRVSFVFPNAGDCWGLSSRGRGSGFTWIRAHGPGHRSYRSRLPNESERSRSRVFGLHSRAPGILVHGRSLYCHALAHQNSIFLLVVPSCIDILPTRLSCFCADTLSCVVPSRTNIFLSCPRAPKFYLLSCCALVH